jgi:hypothetical protein
MENTSGKGSLYEVPKEVKKWNWGAFWLTWIWGIFNGTYIALLALLPIANLVMPFYLGVKGNELAWRNSYWYSTERFHQSQRKWAIAGWIIGLIFILGTTASIVSRYKADKLNNQITQEALTILKKDAKAKEFIGQDFKIQMVGGLQGVTMNSVTQWYAHTFITASEKGTFWISSSLDENRNVKEIKVSKFGSTPSLEDSITIDPSSPNVEDTNIDKEIEKIKSDIENLAIELGKATNKEQVNQILSNYYKTNKDKINSIYFGDENGGMSVNPTVDFPDSYDPRFRPWYEGAKISKIYESEIYTDIATEQKIKSIAKAVLKDNKLVGVVGVDADLGK